VSVAGADRDAAFTAFVAARQDHLRRIAVAVCGDPHRAEDVLQDALTKLYLAWPRVRRDGREEAYARRIIVRADLDDRRRPWRRERTSIEGHDPAAPASLAPEDRDSLYDALRALPPMQRRTVLLRHWLGLSVAETAADLGVAEGTVKAYTARALDALRHHLDDTPTTLLRSSRRWGPDRTSRSPARRAAYVRGAHPRQLPAPRSVVPTTTHQEPP